MTVHAQENQAGKPSLHWQGRLLDTAFHAGDTVIFEVLETGFSDTGFVGQGFSAQLPKDTVWNFCFTSPRLEKCFELFYQGIDSSIQTDIRGDAVLVRYIDEDKTGGDSTKAKSALDTLLESSPQEVLPEVDAESVTMKKVVLRLRRQPKRALGKSTISAKLIKRVPGLAEADVIRSIQALPGVVASSDFSTKIYVRGGSADQNLFLFDNAEVYSPVHFFGLFSTFLVEGIDDVEFYKGGFSPQYGNRLASVVDIKSRKGGSDTVDAWMEKSSLKLSTFAGQLHTEGKQGPWRWLVAGRRTWIKEALEFFRYIDATTLNVDYYFYDLQGNLSYQIAPDHSISLSGYSGDDILNFTPFEVTWGNRVYPLNYHWKINTDWATDISLSYSQFKQSFGLENIFSLYNEIENKSYKHSVEYTGIEDHALKIGLDVSKLKTIFSQTSEVAGVKTEDKTLFWLDALYLQDKWSLGDLELTYGARASYQSALDDYTIEPRISLQYKLANRQTLDLHVGYYTQFVNSLQFSDQETLNEFYYPSSKTKYSTLPPTNSLLFSAGYAKNSVLGEDWLSDHFTEDGRMYQSLKGWDFTLEGYYKTLNNLFVFAPEAAPDSLRERTDTKLADYFIRGEGYSLGWEMSLKKEAEKVFGGLSFSQGYTVAKEENEDDAYFPKWHQAYSFKADGGINWRGKSGIFKPNARKYLRSSAQLKYASGLPYTEILGWMPSHLIDQNQGDGAGGPNPEYQGNVQAINGPRNGAYVPPYIRLDIKAIDWGREGHWNFSWTLLNLTNHENVFLYLYNRETNPPERISIPQFPFFPLLVSYEYYF